MDGDGDPESVGQPEEASPEEQPEEACAEASEEERPEDQEEEDREAAAYLAELPEPLLLRVLAELPAAELVRACRLVCLRWKELVDGAPLWLLKCQQEGLAPEGGAEDERDHWQQFYFLSKRRRNLLRNPCGEEDLEGWSDVEHGGDGWRVEELPGDCGVEFTHDDGVKKFFASSFEWCRKAQVIDLQAEGYWEELLDTTQPAIVVKDWYSGRCDAGCLYELTVKLLSENEDVLAEFSSGQVAVPQDSDGEGWIEVSLEGWRRRGGAWALGVGPGPKGWGLGPRGGAGRRTGVGDQGEHSGPLGLTLPTSGPQISHTFTDYGPGVRFVRFEHGGQDSVYWKGWFGARVTNSSVWVEP
uniref:F-box protein 2 n=1 Tax=Microcebus murinus TaxID=30608 RepID=A0A8C6EK76_MICMU